MATNTEDRGSRKTREGIVVSDKMDKTITVEVSNRVAHGMYSKVMSRSHKLKAHDETNSAGTGDRVLIMETRPISASKRWRLVQIIEKAKYGANKKRFNKNPAYASRITQEQKSFSVSVYSEDQSAVTQASVTSSSVQSRMQSLVDRLRKVRSLRLSSFAQ